MKPHRAATDPVLKAALGSVEKPMSLLDLLTQVQGGKGLEQLGQKIGLDANMTQALAKQLAPAIAGGAKRKAKAEGGLGSLLGQLMGEQDVRYYKEPAEAASEEARARGGQFLENIFGSADASQQIANAAAERTGAPQNLVAQFLPAIAAALQGAMQSQAPDDEIKGAMGAMGNNDRAGAGISDLLGSLGGGGAGGLAGMIGGLVGGGGAQSSGGGLQSILQMLDADGDGSPLDDIIEKFT